VYVADSGNNRIRKITPGGLVTTLAGGAPPQGAFDDYDDSDGYADGLGAEARFSNPNGVAVDGSGNVYVADSNNGRIRKISPSGSVVTLAGRGGGNGSGIENFTDAQGTLALFYNPRGVTVDGNGNVYVADSRIRKVTAAGTVTTLAGSGSAAFADGKGASASFSYPWGVAVDGSGNVYVADTFNNRIRKITISE